MTKEYKITEKEQIERWYEEGRKLKEEEVRKLKEQTESWCQEVRKLKQEMKQSD